MYNLDYWVDEFDSAAKSAVSKVAQHTLIYVERGSVLLNGKPVKAGETCYVEDFLTVEAKGEGATLWRWGLDRQDAAMSQLHGKGVYSVPKMRRHIKMFELVPRSKWLFRLDQILGFMGTTGLHAHPGSGIRVLLEGSIQVESNIAEESSSQERGAVWYEEGSYPVVTTSRQIKSSFVRCMVLPPQYHGHGDTANWISGFDGSIDGTARLQDIIVMLH